MLDFDLYRLYGGEIAGPVSLCHVTRELAKLIGAYTSVVRVSKEDIQKIRYKHRVAFRHLRLASVVIRYGAIFREHKRPRHLVFTYYDRVVFGKMYRAVLKRTNERHEIYLETFHRILVSDYNAMVRKRQKIRDQMEEGDSG